MPLLPRGMYRRGSAFYLRSWEGGRERRRSLGTQYTKALELYHRIKGGGERATVQGTVAKLGELWIDVSVKTRRIERGVRETRSRFRRLFRRFGGAHRGGSTDPGRHSEIPHLARGTHAGQGEEELLAGDRAAHPFGRAGVSRLACGVRVSRSKSLAAARHASDTRTTTEDAHRGGGQGPAAAAVSIRLGSPARACDSLPLGGALRASGQGSPEWHVRWWSNRRPAA